MPEFSVFTTQLPITASNPHEAAVQYVKQLMNNHDGKIVLVVEDIDDTVPLPAVSEFNFRTTSVAAEVEMINHKTLVPVKKEAT